MGLLDKILSKVGASETKKKVFRNLYWAVLGKVVTLLGSLFVGILVARYLGPEQYGLMSYVISYVSLFQIFASFGMDGIEVREMSKKETDVNLILGTVFRLKLLLALVTIILVVVTALFFESDNFTISLITLYSLSIILNCFNVIRSYFTSIVWNEYIVKSEISRTLLGACVKVILLLLKAPLWVFIIAVIFDLVLLYAGYVLAYQTKIGSISLWRYDRRIAKYILQQSFPLMLSAAAVIIYQRIDQVMIGNMIDMESVGQFSVAAKFVEIVLFVPMMISQTITPMLVKLRDVNEKEYKIKIQFFQNVTVWFTFIISCIVSFLSYWIVLYSFGEKYLLAVPILQIMIFKSVGMALAYTSGQIIIIEKKQKNVIYRNLLGCIVCIGLNLFFIPKYGIIACAYISIVATFVSGCFAHIFISDYRLLFKSQMKCLLLGWLDVIKIRKILR